MIGKISHGNSFGDCLDYLTRVKQDKQPSEKRVWHIIDSDGVRLNVGEEALAKDGDIGCGKTDAHKVKNQRPVRTHFTRFFAE